jgi:hypothetical protein
MFAATVMRIDRTSYLGFEAFFQAEYERLLRTMFVHCRSRSEAEDLAQETMARVFERWDRSGTPIHQPRTPMASLSISTGARFDARGSRCDIDGWTPTSRTILVPSRNDAMNCSVHSGPCLRLSERPFSWSSGLA